MHTCDSCTAVSNNNRASDASRRGIFALNAPAIDYPRAGRRCRGASEVLTEIRQPVSQKREPSGISPLLFITRVVRSCRGADSPSYGKSYGLSGFRVHRAVDIVIAHIPVISCTSGTNDDAHLECRSYRDSSRSWALASKPKFLYTQGRESDIKLELNLYRAFAQCTDCFVRFSLVWHTRINMDYYFDKFYLISLCNF